MTKLEKFNLAKYLQGQVKRYNEAAQSGLITEAEKKMTEILAIGDLLARVFNVSMNMITNSIQDDMLGYYDLISELTIIYYPSENRLFILMKSIE